MMTEEEARKFIAEHTKKSLLRIIVPILSLIGIADVVGFIALWRSANEAATQIATSVATTTATKAAENALTGQKSLIDDIDIRAKAQSTELTELKGRVGKDTQSIDDLESKVKDATGDFQNLQSIPDSSRKAAISYLSSFDSASKEADHVFDLLEPRLGPKIDARIINFNIRSEQANLAALENARKTQKDPKRRASLDKSIAASKKRLEAFKSLQSTVDQEDDTSSN